MALNLLRLTFLEKGHELGHEGMRDVRTGQTEERMVRKAERRL